MSSSTEQSTIRTASWDDAQEAERALCACLHDLGFPTCPFASAGSGPTIIFHDSKVDGLADFVYEASRGASRVLVIDCTIGETRQRHWQFLSLGASDVLVFSTALETAQYVASRLRRWEEVDRILTSDEVANLMIGASPSWTQVLRRVIEIATFTTSPVLVTGESGTGKELAARMIHRLDRREKKGQLVLLDCSTIVPELSGSEFFGHEKGAYTGAGGQRDGAFALADGGTLFLDEVGELPSPLQAQLLRAVQEKTYKRLGSNIWRETDFRLICATNRDLILEIESGRFRGDLYYRIASSVCHLPSLRERPEDILILARAFLKQTGSPAPDFDNSVADYLRTRDYPGNVRDLRQIVSRMAYRHTGPGPVTAGDVAPEDRPAALENADWRDTTFRRSVQRALASGSGLKEIGRAAESVAEEIVLEEEQGNLQRAARRLQITDRALQLRRQARKLTPAG